MFSYQSRIGPDKARRLVSRKTGKDNHHLINVTVIIPVVRCIIHVRMLGHHHFDSLPYFIVTIIVSPLLLGGTLYLVRTHDVELQITNTARLVAEVVGYTARTHAFVVALLVEKPVVVFMGVLATERGIAELHQYNHLPIDTRGIPFLGGKQYRIIVAAGFWLAAQVPHTTHAPWEQIIVLCLYVHGDHHSGYDSQQYFSYHLYFHEVICSKSATNITIISQ